MRTKLPDMGFGVYKAGEAVYAAVRLALDVGYRHIDCAKIYGNEKEVGRAIRESGVPRGDIFVTTKLWPTEFDRPEAAFYESLHRLGLDYVDAYLLHWPGLDLDLRHRAWDAIWALQAQGLVAMPGVSNFLPPHLQALAASGALRPGCNQLEMHPWFHQDAARLYCHSHDIPVVCWAPIFRGKGTAEPTLLELGCQHGKSPAQIVLRWHLQRGEHPIPKSVTPARIRENFEIFDFILCDAEMARIDALETGEHLGKDPMTYQG